VPAKPTDEAPVALTDFKATVKLRSLAPEYVSAQHDGYVRHLEDAIKDPKNRNIALTGRYGSGKSSVLDHFSSKHTADTLRISINTLGPDDNEEDLTNRIQKELVKQLVYRAEAGKLRRSRFARSAPLTRRRAFGEALGITAAGLLLLWLVGLRPGETWFGATSDPFWTLVGVVVFVTIVVSVVYAVRWLVGDRIVSQVSTAGTTITLGEKPTTYFDGYLDEIVTFFEAVEPKYVVFEDLDRFDDPQIFDSLRELNTLINSSAYWIAKGEPLRFIYAIKDSLFEQLGVDPEDREDPDGKSAPLVTANEKKKPDLAAAAVERANRTKFFELVIPVVPFISHRNARDHLAEAFNRLGLPPGTVTRPLLDLVARHTTDMRLLINICNEFAVFAEHLLWVDNRAPGMTADDLFALVVYKNFHLADFEAIAQRTSSLDSLENYHRDLVRTTTVELQKKRRELVQTEEKRQTQDRTAEILGRRLATLGAMFSAQAGRTYAIVDVNGNQHGLDVVRTASFWKAVSESKAITLTSRQGYGVSITGEDLSRLFPESLDTEHWRDANSRELTQQIRQYDRDIATLRGADFKDLDRFERFPRGATPFKAQISSTLTSELARDLVRRGFLTRNYAEYSAEFYGSFLGVDVAFYYNHSVQPNQMYVDFEFKTKNAVANLLEQVPADFTSSVSALNIQIVTHLLKNDLDGVKEVVAFVVADYNDDAKTFLETYLNTPGLPHESLVGWLAAHPWRGVFDYISSLESMPDEETRIRLLDAALLNSADVDSYNLNDRSRSFLVDAYSNLAAFTQPQSIERAERIFSFCMAASLLVSDLRVLGDPLRKLIVTGEMYKLTAANIQAALGITTAPTLDEVRKDESVWHYCQENVDTYMAALRTGAPGHHVLGTESVLKVVIVEQQGIWTDDQLVAVISASAPEAALKDINSLSTDAWPLVMSSGSLVPSVANIQGYVDAFGVDSRLAEYLTTSENSPIELTGVDEITDEQRVSLAVQILNAGSLLPAITRVGIVEQLNLPAGVDPTALVPAGDDLLARALEVGLVPDDRGSFTHFATGGWASVEAAFAVSSNIEHFLEPALVTAFVAELLQSPMVSAAIRSAVVENLPDYVPNDDTAALRAAGSYAAEKRIKLPFDEIVRIARVTQDSEVVLTHLVRSRALSTDQLIDALVSLGSPFKALVGGPGAEFDLPAASSAKTILERLAAAGRVEIINKGWGLGKKVRNLV
jgi:hypothetical protein